MRPALTEAFDAWQGARDDRERLAAIERESRRAPRLRLVPAREIERVAPVAGEDDELVATRQVLANADKLQRLCADAYDALYEGDNAALPALATVWKKVGELAAIDDRFEPYVDARESIKSQLEDLAFFLRSYAADIDASPARLQEIEDRLALLERLKKKHGPALERRPREARVVEARAATRSRTPRSGAPSSIGALDTARARVPRDCRRGLEPPPRRRPAVRCGSRRTRSPSWRCRGPAATCASRWRRPRRSGRERGIESAEFYISPNPGEDLKPLARIASGGELSRIMLALKTLASTDAPGKTLIFDEVDAGIGGAVGGRRRGTAAKAGRTVSGAVHHPSAADRRARHARTSAFRNP